MPIVDLAILDDSRNRKVKVDVQGNRVEEEEEILHFDDVVAFSDDYPSLTEGTIESFTNFLCCENDIDNLYLQTCRIALPDTSKSSRVNCKIDSQITRLSILTYFEILRVDFQLLSDRTLHKQILVNSYNVAKRRYNKPCSILLYGSTGIGKTESAKFIAKTLEKNCLESVFHAPQRRI